MNEQMIKSLEAAKRLLEIMPKERLNEIAAEFLTEDSEVLCVSYYLNEWHDYSEFDKFYYIKEKLNKESYIKEPPVCFNINDEYQKGLEVSRPFLL